LGHLSGIKQSELSGCHPDLPTRRELYGVAQPAFVQEDRDHRPSQPRVRTVLQLDRIIENKGHVFGMPAALIERTLELIVHRHDEVA